MSFLYGALGMLAVIVLIFGSAFLGWKAHDWFDKRTQKKTAKELTQSERQKLQEQQEAFRVLQNYSVERAYGMVPETTPIGSDES